MLVVVIGPPLIGKTVSICTTVVQPSSRWTSATGVQECGRADLCTEYLLITFSVRGIRKYSYVRVTDSKIPIDRLHAVCRYLASLEHSQHISPLLSGYLLFCFFFLCEYLYLLYLLVSLFRTHSTLSSSPWHIYVCVLYAYMVISLSPVRFFLSPPCRYPWPGLTPLLGSSLLQIGALLVAHQPAAI